MMSMTPRQIRAYHRQIERLQASRDLRLLRIVTAPHAGADHQKQVQRDLNQAARGEQPKEIVVSNNADLQRLLRGGQ